MGKYTTKLQNIQEANERLEKKRINEMMGDSSSISVNSIIDMGMEFIHSKVSDNDPNYKEKYDEALTELKRLFDYTIKVLNHRQIQI